MILGIQDVDGKMNILRRDAVRAVIVKDDRILMIHTKKGDYKFPGGGIKEGEDYISALEREVREETGYIVTDVIEKLGEVIERRPDKYDRDLIFEHLSRYYLCEIADEQGSQRLDDYESEQDFCPAWINLNEAITQNMTLLEGKNSGVNPWIDRDTTVLKFLNRM